MYIAKDKNILLVENMILEGKYVKIWLSVSAW